MRVKEREREREKRGKGEGVKGSSQTYAYQKSLSSSDVVTSQTNTSDLGQLLKEKESNIHRCFFFFFFFANKMRFVRVQIS